LPKKQLRNLEKLIN